MQESSTVCCRRRRPVRAARHRRRALDVRRVPVQRGTQALPLERVAAGDERRCVSRGRCSRLALMVASTNAMPAAHDAAERVTAYSSLPLQGPSRPQSVAIVNGIRLALEEAGGRAGAFRVRYVSLDESTAV